MTDDIIQHQFRSPHFWGLECGPGWEKILIDLQDELDHIIRVNRLTHHNCELKFVQIKEKFGTLRIYYDLIGDWTDHCYDMIDQAVSDAEKLSRTTCETCGDEGKNRSINGWLKTECEYHYKQRMEN